MVKQAVTNLSTALWAFAAGKVSTMGAGQSGSASRIYGLDIDGQPTKVTLNVLVDYVAAASAYWLRWRSSTYRTASLMRWGVAFMAVLTGCKDKYVVEYALWYLADVAPFYDCIEETADAFVLTIKKQAEAARKGRF